MSKTKTELAAARDKKWRAPEFEAQVSSSSQYFAFCEGVELGAAHTSEYTQKLETRVKELLTCIDAVLHSQNAGAGLLDYSDIQSAIENFKTEAQDE